MFISLSCTEEKGFPSGWAGSWGWMMGLCYPTLLPMRVSLAGCLFAAYGQEGYYWVGRLQDVIAEGTSPLPVL